MVNGKEGEKETYHTGWLQPIRSICSVLNRFNENHAKKELVPTTTSSEMLMPALVGRGNPSSSCVQAEAMGGKGSSWPRKNI